MCQKMKNLRCCDILTVPILAHAPAEELRKKEQLSAVILNGEKMPLTKPVQGDINVFKATNVT